MKNETLEGFFPRLIGMDLPPSRFFYSGKRKITLLSSKNIKRISAKFKNIHCCRYAIPEIRKVTTQINSEKQFRLKFSKVAKVADCKIIIFFFKK